MGAADDIKKGLTKSLANFTKQRKAEEKHSSAGRWRTSRMIEVRGMFLTEAANEVMEECYMKASDNGRLPATARQIFYVARPLIEEQTDKPLSYSYFSQTLLPNYINEHGRADWDVVYDDRGHFMEPHTKRVIGLGTLNVRAYLSRVGDLELEEADFDPASVKTYGPDGCFGAVLYVEKEGFMPLFERVKLAERYDIAIMSSKGMSVTAARQLADGICRYAFRCWCCMISIARHHHQGHAGEQHPALQLHERATTSSTSGCTMATSAACRPNLTIPTSATSGSRRPVSVRPRSTSCAISGSN